MAHQAGMSDSVKLVEEPREEEEPLPIIQLQAPPKKFKRQLSADNSPPDKLTAAAGASAQDKEHVQQGQLTSSSTGRAASRAPHEPPTLSHLQAGVHGDGGSYSSSALSPKRLKSEHGALPCTPPKSPLVKQLTAQVADTTLDRRGAPLEAKTATCAQSRQSDVVHIFPQLMGEEADDANNNNNTSTDRVKVSDVGTSDNRSGDETDARQKPKERKEPPSDVVSVLHAQLPKRAATPEKEKPSGMKGGLQTACQPQESMQTLQMLFGRKGDAPGSKSKHPSSAKEPDSDGQSVRSERQSDPLLTKGFSPSASSSSQKTDLPDLTDAQTTNAQYMQSKAQTASVSSSSRPCVSPRVGSAASPSKMTPNRGDDSATDSDPYTAELSGRLQDIQRMIFSQHGVFASQAAAQNECGENEASPASGPRQTADPDRNSNSGISVSKEPSPSPAVPTSSTASHGQTEEGSRTARLCRSESNPFSFSSADIERAKAVLSCDVPALTAAQSHGQESREERSEFREESKSRGQFQLGDLWIRSCREGQFSALTAHRQLSDPGSFHPPAKLNPVLEKVKPTALRQFSEPAKALNQTGNQESSEFQRNPKQPGRSLQQPFRFCSENPEGGGGVEGHPTFFLGEEEKGAKEATRRNCATPSPSPVVSQGYLQWSPVESLETSRKRQPFPDLPARERAFGRDHAEPFRQTHEQTHFRPGPGEHVAASSGWICPPRPPAPGKDRMCGSFRQGLEDDSVFVDGGPEGGSPFKNPAVPGGPGDRFLDRSAADRSPCSRLSADTSPRRPALRSQSNVEQSPNKAELEAMAHYKYLRSFSEHISDPQRLIEQLRAMPPADCDQLMEQLQGMRRAPLSTSFNSEKEADRCAGSRADRHRTVRRTLFQEADDLDEGGYEVAEWQQQGCYTYPPPLARRQSLGSGRDHRRSRSCVRDMESAGHRGLTRSRQPGDLDVTLECTQATAATHQPYYNDAARAAAAQHPETLRMKIESYIQQILTNHLQIRPSGACQADMNLWIAQAAEIERLTQEASQLIGTLSEHNRSVYDVLTGSVVVKVRCSTLLGVLDLWEKFQSGALQGLVEGLFGGDRLLAVTGLTDVEVKVSLCHSQYTACLEELGNSLAAQTTVQSPRRLDSVLKDCTDKEGAERPDQQLDEFRQLRPPSWCPPGDVTIFDAHELMMSPARLSPTCTVRSPSTPSKRQGKFTYGDCSTRKAFSELNLSDGELTPTSPTSKKFFDALQKENSVLSPLASPSILLSPTTRSRTSLSDVTIENGENDL